MRTPSFLVVALFALSASAQDGTFDPSFNPTDAGMARYDALHWAAQPSNFPGEGVRAMVVQSDGRLLVGGWFPGGVIAIEDPIFRSGIARLNVDGSADAGFNAGAGFDGPVEVIAVQPDGKILVGGAFLNCQGAPRKGIARLNANGSLDATFTVGTGTGGTVFEIAVQADGRIILGGNFTTYNALPTNRIVRLLSDGSYDASLAIGSGFNGTVKALAIQVDGKVLVGGSFTSYNGAPRGAMARLLTNGILDPTYADPGVYTEVTDVQTGAAGAAYWVGDAGLLKLGLTGVAVPGFSGLAGGPSSRIAYRAGSDRLYVFGSYSFRVLNGTTGSTIYDGFDYQVEWYHRTSCYYLIVDWRNSAVGPSGEIFRLDPIHTGILRVNSDMTLDHGFKPGMGLAWLSTGNLGMTQDAAGQIAIGGRTGTGYYTTFPSYDGAYQPDLVRLTTDGEVDGSFPYVNGTEGWISDLWAVNDGYLFTGGLNLPCGTASGAALVNSWLYHDATNTLSALPTSGGCASPRIKDMVELADGRILYVGTNTCTPAVTQAGRFAADRTWDPLYAPTPITGDPRCMAMAPDGKAYVAGEFSVVGGLPRQNIARLLANGGVDPAFDPLGGFDNDVRDMIVNPDGSIVCVGDFTTYRGMPAPHIAKLLPNAAMDPSFDPGTGIANAPMCMLRYPDGRILIGGAIPMYDGNVVNGIVCINADGSIDETFDQGEGFRINNPTINAGTPGGGYVVDMEMQPDGKVVCLGEFHMYDGNGRNRVARIGSGASVLMMARVFLEGAYTGSDTMSTLLGPGLIPLNEPYGELGYEHVRGGSESISPSVLLQQGAGAIVDWVMVELRDAADSTVVVATRSGLLRADGWIVDTDGISPLRFFGTGMGLYYVVVRHRNHLGIMSAAPVIMGSAPYPVDFTGPNQGTYGSNAQKVAGSHRMLWAGDVNHDGVIKYTGGGNNANDRDPILSAIGGLVPTNSVNGQYRQEDLNMDGSVKYTGNANDRDIILQNIGGVVPTNTRLEQLP